MLADRSMRTLNNVYTTMSSDHLLLKRGAELETITPSIAAMKNGSGSGKGQAHDRRRGKSEDTPNPPPSDKAGHAYVFSHPLGWEEYASELGAVTPPVGPSICNWRCYAANLTVTEARGSEDGTHVCCKISISQNKCRSDLGRTP